jgi:hypothetical protein
MSFYASSEEAEREREREKQITVCNFLILLLKDIEVNRKYGAVCGPNKKLNNYSGQNCTSRMFPTTMR